MIILNAFDLEFLVVLGFYFELTTFLDSFKVYVFCVVIMFHDLFAKLFFFVVQMSQEISHKFLA